MQNYYSFSSIQVIKNATPNAEDLNNHIETFTAKKKLAKQSKQALFIQVIKNATPNAEDLNNHIETFTAKKKTRQTIQTGSLPDLLQNTKFTSKKLNL